MKEKMEEEGKVLERRTQLQEEGLISKNSKAQ